MASIRTKRLGQKEQRTRRVRAKISASPRPRLSIFRSNKFMYVQLIDDENQKTIATATSQGKKVSGKEAARLVGAEIAKKATKAGITEVVFDRGGYSYEGNIRELAESAREGGLHF